MKSDVLADGTNIAAYMNIPDITINVSLSADTHILVACKFLKNTLLRCNNVRFKASFLENVYTGFVFIDDCNKYNF